MLPRPFYERLGRMADELVEYFADKAGQGFGGGRLALEQAHAGEQLKLARRKAPAVSSP